MRKRAVIGIRSTLRAGSPFAPEKLTIDGGGDYLGALVA
jgi:hypothetical protein